MPDSSKKFSEKEMVKVAAVTNAAATLFDRNGYPETSLKDISMAAGLSKGGIYHYFSNKHEILYCILDSYMDHLLGNLEQELAEIPDARDRINHLMTRHLKQFNARVPQARALLHHAHNLPSNAYNVVVRKQRRYARMLTDILAEMADKDMDPDRIQAVSFILFGMCNSIVHWYDPEGPVSLDELASISYALFMDGWNSFLDGKPAP